MQVRYVESDSFNQTIKTHIRPAEDSEFLARLQNALLQSIVEYLNGDNVPSSIDGQDKFIDIVEDAINNIIPYEYMKFDIFSSLTDHYGRPIRRYILTNTRDKWKYIFDVYCNLDVYLKLPKIKRELLKWIPYGFLRIKSSEYIPKIIYKLRIWNSPNTSYIIDVNESIMNVPYTSKMDRAREMMGIPSIYNEKELKIYERVDYEIRRAIFDETLDVLKSRIDRKHIQTSD